MAGTNDSPPGILEGHKLGSTPSRLSNLRRARATVSGCCHQRPSWSQPSGAPVPDDPVGDLSDVIALAVFPNVSIKFGGACMLSQQVFPFLDIWDPLERIFDAFGSDRCTLVTGWTRPTALQFTQGFEAFRISASPGG